MPHRGDLATERKLQIINSTLECITELGFNNLSMQDVAKKAGLSKGIIHYYFKNKHELMQSVLGQVCKDIELLLQEIDETSDPIDQVKKMIRLYFSVVQKSRNQYCVHIDFWSQINQYPEFKALIAAHYQQFRKKTADVLQKGFDSGAFDCKIDPQQAASLLVGLVDGISLQWLFDQNSFNFDELTEQCTNLFLQYLTAK